MRKPACDRWANPAGNGWVRCAPVRWARVVLKAVLLCVCVLLVSAALAQEQTEPIGQAIETPPPMDDRQILAGLDDGDYRVRQAMTRRLLLDETLTPLDLDRLYVAAQTPEQRHRLLRVTRHHVIRRLAQQKFGGQGGPGSMGVSHQVISASWLDGPERTGVLVVMTLPGFPAYALLEPGDVIVDFAGQPLADKLSPSQFQQRIREFTAGQTIDLTVLRDGQPLVIRFRLGHGQALREAYDATGLKLSPAYHEPWMKTRTRMQSLITQGDDGDQGVDDDATAFDDTATFDAAVDTPTTAPIPAPAQEPGPAQP